MDKYRRLRWTTAIFPYKIMVMTLQTYNPQQLDQFALRLLDLAAIVRQAANESREYGIADLPVHDKKALEWCVKLEQWARKTRADLEVRILQHRAEMRGATPPQKWTNNGRSPTDCVRSVDCGGRFAYAGRRMSEQRISAGAIHGSMRTPVPDHSRARYADRIDVLPTRLDVPCRLYAGNGNPPGGATQELGFAGKAAHHHAPVPQPASGCFRSRRPIAPIAFVLKGVEQFGET